MSQDSMQERLDELLELLDKLRLANEETPILVEGERDEAALRRLGMEGVILRVKGADSVFAVCEGVGKAHRKAIILTDWDRGGGHLARLLMDMLGANGVRYDADFRKSLSRITKKEVVHVEGLDSYVENLQLAVVRRPGRGPNA